MSEAGWVPFLTRRSNGNTLDAGFSPVKGLVLAAKMPSPELGVGHAAAPVHRALRWCNGCFGGLAAGCQRTDAAKNPAGRLYRRIQRHYDRARGRGFPAKAQRAGL